jgi:L-rhamnose isomerase
MNEKRIVQGYEYAKSIYAEHGIDVDQAIEKADKIPISMHSWQGDDLIGFDGTGELSGGIAATGNYIGRARTPEELRRDIDTAVSMIPGRLKLNLHACHAELNGKSVDRDEYTVDLFKAWIDWARERGMGLDFNPTFFSHPKMDGNFSLASRDAGIRKFWIEHGRRCREIGQEFGRQLGKTCVVNYWMPDGYKDIPADTAVLRKIMAESLDAIFEKELDRNYVLESIESKLFGLGVESYTVASHEFSLGYATTRKKLYCLDAGHFHPTETISSKLSAVLQFLDGVLLHGSRGVRWDSDHVVLWDDELQNIMNEIIFNDYTDRVYIGLDFFDASINRIACWAIGTRNARKALLRAALTPIDRIKRAEESGDFTSRLALIEENKSLPFSPIWDYYCMTSNKPVGDSWLDEVKRYEREVLCSR